MGVIRNEAFYSSYLGDQIDLLLGAMAQANPLPSGTDWVAFIDDCRAAQSAAETAQTAAEAAAAAAQTWSSNPPYIDPTTGDWFVYNTQTQQFVNSGVHAQGPQGATGADGVSPKVTTTTVAGGHRVTITDADHPSGQSFDVMDGGMQASAYDPQGTVAAAGGIPAYVSSNSPKPKVASVNLSTTWAGAGPYTQTVTVSGATANSKIDLQPTAAQLQQLIDDGVQALYISNDNGTLTAYALGAAPTEALTLQCTLTEVTA